MDRWTIALSQTGTQLGAGSCVITCVYSFIRVHRVSSVQAWLEWLLGEEVHVLVSDGDMWRTFVFLPARCQLVYCQLCAFRRGMRMGLFSTHSWGAYPCGLSQREPIKDSSLAVAKWRERAGWCVLFPLWVGGLLCPRCLCLGYLEGGAPAQAYASAWQCTAAAKASRGGWQGKMGCV